MSSSLVQIHLPSKAFSPPKRGTRSTTEKIVLMADQHPERLRTPALCSIPFSLLLISLALITQTSSIEAIHPVQVGLRSAVSNHPFLSKYVTTTTTTRRSTRTPRSTASSTRVIPVNAPFVDYTSKTDEQDDDDDDSVIQSAFWHASSPIEALQSRHIEYPVSRQNSPTTYDDENEPESELDFLEAQVYGGNILASNQKHPRAALAPVASPSSTRRPSQKEKEHLNDHEHTKKDDHSHLDARGGVAAHRPLVFWETMICGAISRSIAQTIMHPANTMKTILQSRRGTAAPLVEELLKPSSFRRLTYGAGANFLLSVPTGALNFAVLEFVRHRMGELVRTNTFLAERQEKLGAGLDFMSSALSTIACSIVATPQMMIVDNIMAGNYPNLLKATQGLYAKQGVIAFYRGWWPGLVGKIPSYALTWTLFQQLKLARNRISKRPARNYENSIMGCLASGTTVCIMIPMDTIKTRLVTQAGAAAGTVPYKGIIDCAIRVAKEEGIGAFYRGLPPRLISVVPMIGIQFGVYEAMKKAMLKRRVAPTVEPKKKPRISITRKKKEEAPVVEDDDDEYTIEQVFEGAAMEVASSGGNPMPVPHMHAHEHHDKAPGADQLLLKHKNSKKDQTTKKGALPNNKLKIKVKH